MTSKELYQGKWLICFELERNSKISKIQCGKIIKLVSSNQLHREYHLQYLNDNKVCNFYWFASSEQEVYNLFKSKYTFEILSIELVNNITYIKTSKS
jgi:hypothetical protein